MAVNYKLLKQTGFMQQKQKNHFSVRIHITGGYVTANQLAKIAEIADKFGNGYVHLTSRQSIEIPFVKLEQIEAFKQALADGNLETSNCGAGVRTVTACQGNAICASGCIDTYELAKELDARYASRILPHKFKIGVTGCQNNCLKAEENDLGIKGAMQLKWLESKCIHCGLCEKKCRHKALKLQDNKIIINKNLCTLCGKCYHACPVKCWDVQQGYIITFGGLFGNTISKGETILPFIAEKQKLIKICDVAIKFFEQHANSGERFKFTLDRTGWQKFKMILQNAYEQA
ncbi:MAG: 4Fe-4S binding protein [Ruminococcus sp.]|nr:4Fe-4S binding protein [Ruminococcus sp.]